MKPSISLVISTYNQAPALLKVFRGVQRQTITPDEIIVAEDGTDPATHQIIEEWKDRLSVPVRHVWQENRGFRKTTILNRAIAVADKQYIVFLDGDCVPHHRFIADHASLAEEGFWVQGRRCFVAEPWVPAFEPGEVGIATWVLHRRFDNGHKAFRFPWPLVLRNTNQRGIIGCNMGIWRADLLAVNGFDQEYTGWGIGEDSDLGTRLYHLGRPRKFVYGWAVVYHLNHPIRARDHLPASLARFQNTIEQNKIRCSQGLDQYLAKPVAETTSVATR